MTNSLLNYKRKIKMLWAINISCVHTVFLYKCLLNIKMVIAGSTPGLCKAQNIRLVICLHQCRLQCRDNQVPLTSQCATTWFFSYYIPHHWESSLSIYFPLKLHMKRDKWSGKCMREYNAGKIGALSSSFLEWSTRVGTMRKREWEFYYLFRRSQREGQLPFMEPWGSMCPAALHPHTPRRVSSQMATV